MAGRGRRLSPALVLAAVAALVVTGCGRGSRLDVDATESAVALRLEEAYELEVTAVRCPDRIGAEEGRVTTCEAELDAGTLPVRIRQRDGEGGVSVEPLAAALVLTRVEADLAAALEERSSRDEVTVSCIGPEERIVPVGEAIRCTADDGEEAILVTVRVRDAWGAVAYELPD